MVGGLQHPATQHGAQDKGNQHRENHGAGNTQGKLPVDSTRGAGEEGHGNDDGGKHDTDADERTGDLPQDRTSVVEGTSVAVRVELGGGRILKKKKKEQ